MNHSYRSAFTLVELAIVLVIIGLLVGGVLVALVLIHASQLRSVTTEFNRYNTAINAFKDKYFALPGDMTNAYAFWGTTLGCVNADVGGNFAGCNGNGDGQITYPGGEPYLVWQHLASAGLIEGTYSGQYATTVAFGVNAPASRFPNAGYSMFYMNPSTFGVLLWPSTLTGDYLFLGSVWTSIAIKPVMTAMDVENLDTKMDDGMPGTGKVIGGNGGGSLASYCYTGTGASSTYTVLSTYTACSMAMLIQ